MLSRFFASRNFHQDDGAVFISRFLENPTDYLSWKDVENCLNRDDVFWELITDGGNKANIPMYKPYWSPVPCQDKKTIHDHIQDKKSFIITGYSKVNRNVTKLCSEIERSCDVNAGVHVYGSRGGSGIVVVRSPAGHPLSVSPGCNTVSCVGGHSVATFTVSGTLTVN